MTALTVERMTAQVTRPGDRDRVDRIQRRLAESVLHDRRAGWHGLEGEWCVRRLELELPLGVEELDATAGERWADLIATAVRALDPDGRTVLHYRTRSQALADLAGSIVAGSSERVWAWRSLGLLTPGDPDPAVDPGGSLLAALRREPELALPALLAAIRRTGYDALDAVLGEAGWVALAGVLDLPVTVGPVPAGGVAPARSVVSAVLTDSCLVRAVCDRAPAPARWKVGVWAALAVAEVAPGKVSLIPAVAAALTARLGTLVGRPGRLVVEPAMAGDLAHPIGPVVTAADPGTPRATTRVADQRERSREDAARPGTSSLTRTRETTPKTTVPTRTTARERPSLADQPIPPTDPVAEERAPVDSGEEVATAWGGLLYLLNSAPAAGVPDDLEADDRLDGRTLRWILHQLAQRLAPVAATDPAALALAGLLPTAAPPSGDEATPDEEVALTAHTARWTEVTMQLVADAAGEPRDGPPSLWALARRPASIVADPGWLEVHLDADGVDLTIRRSGLDLDPGWLGWLGTVVRFRYV